MTEQPPPPSANPPGFGPPPPSYGPPPPYFDPAAPPPPPPPQPSAPGPEFLAFDKHNSVVVDGWGVVFEMRNAGIEISWPEIRSVHYQASPDGKALMVAVMHMDGRFLECVVTPKPPAHLQEWFAQLAWVLGHYRPAG